MNSKQILDREFLEIRAKILQVAASLDRIDRADGDVGSDEKLELLCKGVSILMSDSPDRAEQVQLLFSRDYDETWQDAFQMSARSS